jgi:cell division protein FtsB
MKNTMGKSKIILFSVILFVMISSNVLTAYFLMQEKISAVKLSETITTQKVRINTLQKANDDLNGNYSKMVKNNQYLNDRVNELTTEIENLNEEPVQDTQTQPTDPVQAQATDEVTPDNPSGAITTGSSKEHVKEVLGNPDSIVLNSWWYGKQSWVSFDNNGLVDGWYDGANILKTE